MTKNEVRRNFDFEIRAENNEDHGDFLTGTPIVFGSATDIGGFFREIIDADALNDTDLRDVRFLVNHNTDMIPLARSRNNNANSTMQMEVASDGMHIRVDLDTANNEQARALYSATKRGDISGMSFMFSVNGDRWEDLDSAYPTRHITSIAKVYEVSAVTFPAYESTSLQARDAEALESAKATLESVKRMNADEEMRKKIREMIGGVTNAD